jgi:hypothetical protein
MQQAPQENATRHWHSDYNLQCVRNKCTRKDVEEGNYFIGKSKTASCHIDKCRQTTPVLESLDESGVLLQIGARGASYPAPEKY